MISYFTDFYSFAFYFTWVFKCNVQFFLFLPVVSILSILAIFNYHLFYLQRVARFLKGEA